MYIAVGGLREWGPGTPAHSLLQPVYGHQLGRHIGHPLQAAAPRVAYPWGIPSTCAHIRFPYLANS